MLRMLKTISGICMLVGFMILFRTANLADAFMIDFKSILVRCGLGLSVMFIGYIGIMVTGYVD